MKRIPLLLVSSLAILAAVGCGGFELPELGAPVGDADEDDDDADDDDDDDDGAEGEGEGEGEGGGDEFILCCVAGAEMSLAYDCGADGVAACEAGDTSACYRNGGRDPECN